MGAGTLTICSASAGSGKTYRLTGDYLASLFRSTFNYRRILAVTFTNKATAEMKSRILDNLHRLASGKACDYLPELIKSSGKNEPRIREEAKEILYNILHDYSRFSVSTIDSFFSRIIRSFAREAGLHSGFNFELDHSAILSDAVDEMIASSTGDIQLKNWLTSFALKNIDDEKTWNIKTAILKLAEELFKEKYKILSADERSNLENKQFLTKYINTIKSLKSGFEKKLPELGAKADTIFSEYQLRDEMFYQKGRGIPGFIRDLLDGTVKKPNNYVRETLKDPPKWSKDKPCPQLQAAINGGLDDVIREAVEFYDSNVMNYKSAKAVIEYVYSLGILSDVLRNVHIITDAGNSFLLSDAGEVLSLITKGDQSPFIYEKIGNRYENFMLDEFQDTSEIQWNNFKPLIENSMAEGFDNLVVGDVKQSIYRWRNSNWKILGTVLAGMVDNDRFLSNSLKTNYRSRSNIIKFNNTLFTKIPQLLDDAMAEEKLPVSFRELYSEAVQIDPGKKNGGYVRMEFVEDTEEQIWQELVLEKLPSVIESVQDMGYGASDTGIIVRNGREGSMVLKTLIDYANTLPPEKKGQYNFHVVSNDSLLLANSPVINFLISVMSVVINHSDSISWARMIRTYILASGGEDPEKAAISGENIINLSKVYFPEGYNDLIESLDQMPLFEASESIVKFFGLGNYSWNVAYLSTFQDLVLGFTGSRNSDIRAFLEWWEESGNKKSVSLPDNQDAMRILTIHKSKGLEFKIVILPFISWKLDHDPTKQPILWVKPESPPFSELGVLPVRYGSDLSETIFADSYREEKYSVYLDNLNLLYVALTRAKDAIFSFSPAKQGNAKTVSGALKQAFTGDLLADSEAGLRLADYYNKETSIFEFGEMTLNQSVSHPDKSKVSDKYIVSQAGESLKLKLHGENYFSNEKAELRKKIN